MIFHTSFMLGIFMLGMLQQIKEFSSHTIHQIQGHSQSMFIEEGRGDYWKANKNKQGTSGRGGGGCLKINKGKQGCRGEGVKTWESSANIFFECLLCYFQFINWKNTWRKSESGCFFQILRCDNYEQINGIQLDYSRLKD